MKRLVHITVVMGSVMVTGMLMSGSVLALGIKNPDQDAAATGQGEAFVAQADTPGAIYYNPGGLTQIKGTEFSSGGFVSFRDSQFRGASGNDDLNDPVYSGSFYLSSDLGQEKWRFGVGVNVPFGNASDWGNAGPFKYVVTKSNLMVINAQPTVAYKFNDHVSLGVGWNIYDGNTELERLVPFSLINPLLPDGHFRFHGDGQAFGATVGLLVTVNEHNSIGVTYRSPFSIDFHGNAAVKNDPTGTLGRSPANAEIDFPQSVAAGYAFRPTKRLKLEVDVEWTNWETLNNVKLHSPNPAFANDPSSTIPFNWLDSWFYEVGAQYLIDDHWVVRAGYIYSENTVPDSSFSPSVPDANRNVFSVGLGYSTGRVAIDLVYQYSLSEDRKVTNAGDPTVNGTWTSNANVVMVTSRLKF
ncbi:MAG TPA: outer membrane protein transport protein [Verrucomicrobiae bacterium]|nr:outer membrane protein transport protein [Verrucomicrobiae bacterium]